MTEMTGARLLVQQLEAQGSDLIFGVPGESYLSVLDALYDNDQLDFITCRQEGGAAMMAESYGKQTGRPGICMVTRGPGATNASAGVHVAFQDSTPMILFIGQVGRDMMEREAFQEIDYRRMFGQMAKWVAQIDDAARIPEFITRAYHTALSGRPGPVVLALPEDMLSGPAPDFPISSPVSAPDPSPSPDEITRFETLLKEAEKPLIIVGGGGWSAQVQGKLEEFACREKTPVAASFRCQDYISNDSEAYVGHVGIGIDRNLAAAVRESDLLIVLGARLGEMTTSGYSLIDCPQPAQKMVHVYPQAEEINRVYRADLGMVASASAMMDVLLNIEVGKSSHWADWAARLRENYETFSAPLPHPGNVQMCDVVGHMRDVLPRDAIVTNGAGNYAIWTHRFFPYLAYGAQLAPTCGSMGYGLPAAISAALTQPNRDVVCMAGDGCFMMTCQEFATAVQYGANLVVLVINNSMFGTIRMHQEKNFPRRISGTDLKNPDFAEMARAFGGFGKTVTENSEFSTVFAEARSFDGPALIEIRLDSKAITPVLTLDDLN